MPFRWEIAFSKKNLDIYIHIYLVLIALFNLSFLRYNCPHETIKYPYRISSYKYRQIMCKDNKDGLTVIHPVMVSGNEDMRIVKFERALEQNHIDYL